MVTVVKEKDAQVADAKARAEKEADDAEGERRAGSEGRTPLL